jgi:toxin ParE1/3/4
MAASKVKAVWTRTASRHLRSAYDYWSRESSLLAADTMLDRVFAAVEMLERYPEAGRGGRVSGTREFVISPTPFLIAYRTRRRRIEIVALLHGARKWPESF